MATGMSWNSEGRLGLGAKERTYYVLLAHHLSEKQKVEISSRILQTSNGIEAERMAGKDGWGCTKLDTMGRVRVATFRGAEVALFYKRQVGEVKVEDCDPVPEGALADPNDVWMRIDLLSAEAKDTASRLRVKVGDLVTQLDLAKQEITVKEKRIDLLETNIRALTKDLAARETELHEAKSLSRRALAGLIDVGIEPYSPAIGSRYDNKKQEAASRVPGPSDKVGVVLGISRVGYLHRKRILVKAKVSIGTKQK